MKNKRSMLRCDSCQWTRILEQDISGLVLIPSIPLQANLPKLDPKTGKTVLSTPIEQKRKFKCPTCGRVVVEKPVPPPLLKAILQKEISDMNKKLEEDQNKRIEDGKPPERTIDPDFKAGKK